MTTNAGAADLAKAAIGFGNEVPPATITKQSIACSRGVSQPPGRHHLVQGAGAGDDRRVVDKFVLQLEEQLADRNVTIELSRMPANGWPSAATITSSCAAVARIISGTYQEALAEELLFRPPRQGRYRPGHAGWRQLDFAFREDRRRPVPKERSWSNSGFAAVRIPPRR